MTLSHAAHQFINTCNMKMKKTKNSLCLTQTQPFFHTDVKIVKVGYSCGKVLEKKIGVPAF